MPDYDVIIIGSGIAALTIADHLAPEKNVAIITKKSRENSNSTLAQGGIAGALGDGDTFDAHYSDTLVAGCHHNNVDAVQALVTDGPGCIRRLIDKGMNFDMDNSDNLILGKEGAHSVRRIVHAGGDATGKLLIRHMLQQVSNKIDLIEHETAIDLMMSGERCVGVKTHGAEKRYTAQHVVLATGGCGGLYSYTSNDLSITGDGIAMAFRAGAKLVDLEFVQFHPTLLYSRGQGKGLISEAVRGEGASLVNDAGVQIMKYVHILEDLAPRDIVARTIFSHMIAGENIFLDISMIGDFEDRFPTITEMLYANGIDPKDGMIPVIPGAHFFMGGVHTDLYGRTSIKGLFAAGECACTGVHGANRLASNSLLEGMVYGRRIAKKIAENKADFTYILTNKLEKHPPVLISLPETAQIQYMMMKHVGINRTEKGLRCVIGWLEIYKRQFDGQDLSSLTEEQLTRVNMIITGWLVATSALMRTESRGAHYRMDFPARDDLNWYQQSIIRKNDTKTQSVGNV